MLILMVITLMTQIFFRRSFQRTLRSFFTRTYLTHNWLPIALIHYLPMTLAMKRVHAKMERRWRHRIKVKGKDHVLEDIDLFDRKRELNLSIADLTD